MHLTLCIAWTHCIAYLAPYTQGKTGGADGRKKSASGQGSASSSGAVVKRRNSAGTGGRNSSGGRSAGRGGRGGQNASAGGPAVQSGFLHKQQSSSKRVQTEPSKVWLQLSALASTSGAVLGAIKNPLIFVTAAAAMHWGGHVLAL